MKRWYVVLTQDGTKYNINKSDMNFLIFAMSWELASRAFYVDNDTLFGMNVALRAMMVE